MLAPFTEAILSVADGTDDRIGSTVSALVMRGVSKAFGKIDVLRNIEFTLGVGEIHALMGENGAGKSTLMKIAGGIYHDYRGEMEVFGVPVRFASPRDASRAGIAVIHQELNLVPTMTVSENIFLGNEKVRGLPFLIDRHAQARAAARLLDPLNFQASPHAPVSDLRIGEQQLVEVAKALAQNARILIMDEPTSALSVTEAERLHAIIRRLSLDGVSVIYISHRMEEVFDLAQRVTVLRDGAVAGTLPAANMSRRDLIRLMVGRDVQEFLALRHEEPAREASPIRKPPALSVHDLWLAHPKPTASRSRLVDRISFDVTGGEVLGLAGLMGAGRSEVLETIFGAQTAASGGQVAVDGLPVTIRTPAEAKQAGLALVTEDRKRDGLVLDAGVDFNLVLPVMQRLASGTFISRKSERDVAERQIQSLRIRVRSQRQPAGTLSGGNQQKVVLGKWLETGPSVLLLDEPTRGIDVGAKAEIYRLINDLKARGIAIVLASSELPELMALSDRILVLREGQSTALLQKSEFSPDLILDYASPGGAVQEIFQRRTGVIPEVEGET
ncbi:sugar ABC transporter ATP-binding protein [Microvirga sp. TS319]|uniref:sugar ABC transporter ATP-binding protein n=1 Tax=Microvirga sp. TS319 TaxID=3241165 RepID=UPI00351AAD67